MRKNKESVCLKACQDWLDMKGILYVRHNSIGLRREGGGFRRIRESQKGAPDIITSKKISDTQLNICIPIGIECKSATGKLSPAQERWRTRAENAGWLYVIVREISDLIKVLEES